jgi:UDP-3-O-[3-hydroxymyristoyl] N-acetylglucosamine deacetylase
LIVTNRYQKCVALFGGLFIVKNMSSFKSAWQHTLTRAVSCRGVGLHSGLPVRLAFLPAPAGNGITFKRVDVTPTFSLPATHTFVEPSPLCTTLTDGTHKITTIEHVMAAFYGLGVDNAIIEVDAPEMPIMDGSSGAFVDLISKAGITRQQTPRIVLSVLRTVRVQEGDKWAELSPFNGLSLDITIDFESNAIGQQRAQVVLEDGTFTQLLSRARTFGFAHEVASLRALGLARGGSLENAVVVDGNAILNPEGLRVENEFVRHKMLDALGDLALAGHTIRAAFRAHKPGHYLTWRLLEEVFQDADNYSLDAYTPSNRRQSFIESSPDAGACYA